MKIAVLSGKGGTGKTLLSVNLAAAEKKSVYIDCDIEEPNGYLFLKPTNIEKEEVVVKVPQVNRDLCNGSRRCVEFCRYNALTYVKDRLINFQDICHSCGGCILVCPHNALTERDRPIGRIERGLSYGIEVNTGILNTGEASGIPIINRLLEINRGGDSRFIVIDCPPGSACSVMESIKDADYCLLVAEPTIFGAHNLQMVYDLVKLFKKPFGVVLNKTMEGKNLSRDFCIENNLKIIGELPFDNELAILNSNGQVAVRESKKYRKIFSNLLEKIREEVHLSERTPNS